MPKTKKKKVEGPGQRRNSGGRPWKRLPESGSGEQRPRQIEETKGRGNQRSQDNGQKALEELQRRGHEDEYTREPDKHENILNMPRARDPRGPRRA